MIARHAASSCVPNRGDDINKAELAIDSVCIRASSSSLEALLVQNFTQMKKK